MKPFYKFISLFLLIPTFAFAAPVSFEDTLNHYAQKDFRVLLVPGHSNREWGTDFLGVKEADLTVELAWYLNDYLSEDKNIKSFVTRKKDGEFSPWLSEYFKDTNGIVKSFYQGGYQTTKAAIESGSFKVSNGVYHNRASDQTVRELYGINKFANDNRIDLVVHIHFNDHPGRKKTMEGKYSGVSIYVPDSQFQNSKSSGEYARSVLGALNKITESSDYPGERSGIVPDQELIAIGSHGTRDGASVLVEYGYIYEQQYKTAAVRSAYLKELAYLTFKGIEEKFNQQNSNKEIQNNSSIVYTSLLPHEWRSLPKFSSQGVDVLALQRALVIEGVYPPAQKNFRDCPLSGKYGKCTDAAIRALENKLRKSGVIQSKNQTESASIINQLNTLYGVRS